MAARPNGDVIVAGGECLRGIVPALSPSDYESPGLEFRSTHSRKFKPYHLPPQGYFLLWAIGGAANWPARKELGLWMGQDRPGRRHGQFLSFAIPLCVRLCYHALSCGAESLCFQILSADCEIVRLASYVLLIMPGWGHAGKHVIGLRLAPFGEGVGLCVRTSGVFRLLNY